MNIADYFRLYIPCDSGSGVFNAAISRPGSLVVCVKLPIIGISSLGIFMSSGRQDFIVRFNGSTCSTIGKGGSCFLVRKSAFMAPIVVPAVVEVSFLLDKSSGLSM